jgi:hypothetical protein
MGLQLRSLQHWMRCQLNLLCFPDVIMISIDMKNIYFNLSKDSVVYGDSAYTDYYNEQVNSESLV